jgi:dTDP-4-dehydrorhamnose reductase
MESKKKILILGGRGMLGSMITSWFCRQTDKYEVRATEKDPGQKIEKLGLELYRFNAIEVMKDQMEDILNDFSPDYVINCIGLIRPYCLDHNYQGVKLAIKVNALFPFELSEFFTENYPEARIIQIATDCVYKGNIGYYDEDAEHDPTDVYGKTKSLGEVTAANLLNVRCSIIGPELENRLSLLEWFLNQKGDAVLDGFDHHRWNGLTTLQFARFCAELIDKDLFAYYRDMNSAVHIIYNEDVTKYELLNIFAEVFGKSCKIRKRDDIGKAVNRTLRSKYLEFPLQPMKEAIIELKGYIDSNSLYRGVQS